MKGFAIVVAFAGVMFFARLGDRTLWASHEARAAQNADSLLTHFTAVPVLIDGQPEFQKPAGYYWLAATTAWATGDVDAWAIRFPAALSALICVVVVYLFLHQRNRPVAAFVAALVLASMIRFTASARVARIDMPLTAAVTLGLLAWFWLKNASEGARPSLAQIIVASACVAFAIVLKGPIGLALPAFALLMVYVVERRLPPIASLIASLFLIGMLAGPWYVWAHIETGGEFTDVFFWYHNVQRALGGAAALAGYPWWYYVPRLMLDALPWLPLILLARPRGDAESRFGLVWLVAMVALLSCSRFKRADYLLPAFPGLAIVIGCACERVYLGASGRHRRWLRGGFVTILLGCGVGWWGYDRWVAPADAGRHDPTAFARLVRQHAGGEPIMLYRVESHLLALELGAPLISRVEWHHLNWWLQPPGEHFFVTLPEYVAECHQNVKTRTLVEVARSESVCPTLRRPFVLMKTR